MNIKHVAFGATAALIAWPAFAQTQAPRPVTAQDLSGKTICWDDGRRVTYAKDGRLFGARGSAHPVNRHNWQWSVVEPGVVFEFSNEDDKERNLEIVVLPDGRVERYGVSQPPRAHSGARCCGSGRFSFPLGGTLCR